MKKWWESKKRGSRKRRKDTEHYSFCDFVVDVIFFLPELIVLPFRFVFWLTRGMIRLIVEWF